MKIKERYAGILKIRDCPALLTSLTIVFKYFQFKKGRLYYRNYCARKEVFKTYLFRTYWRILFYLHRTEITVLVSSNHVISFYNTKKNFRLQHNFYGEKDIKLQNYSFFIVHPPKIYPASSYLNNCDDLLIQCLEESTLQHNS